MQAFKKIIEAFQSPAASVAAKAIASGSAVLGGVVYSYNEMLYNVPAGHAAIVYNRIGGIGTEVYDEGTHFKMPWFQRVVQIDVKSRPLQITSPAGSKDLQMVNVAVRVLTHPNKSKLPEIYRQLGKQFDEKVLPSIVNEVVKAVVARYTAAELTTMRERISSQITETLNQRLREFNIVLDDFSIVHLGFSQEYMTAVESKKVAQQQSERAKYHVLRASEEKKATIIKAEGDGKAAELIGLAINDNPGYIELKNMEVARDIAKIVSRSSNKVMLDSSALLLNVLNQQDLSEQFSSEKTKSK